MPRYRVVTRATTVRVYEVDADYTGGAYQAVANGTACAPLSENTYAEDIREVTEIGPATAGEAREEGGG